jgi:hypothetical protein
MIKGRNNKRLIALLFALMFFAAGCSSSNNTSGIEASYVKQDLSGVWMGYFGNNFALGIISTEDQEHYSAWFIGSNIQYVSPADSFLEQVAPSSIFQGDLNDFEWDTNGLDYQSSSRALFISGPVQTKSLFGGGLFPGGYYMYEDNQQDMNAIIFYYNTTYDLSPNVNDISGQWEIKDEFKTGNTLVLAIALSSSTTGTTISGEDDRGNTFDGTIKIHYNSTPHNVYDLNLTCNNTINFTGLATYILGATTEGITLPQKTLAIGATGTNDGITYSLTGFGDVKQ